jgi:hypothetical protein
LRIEEDHAVAGIEIGDQWREVEIWFVYQPFEAQTYEYPGFAECVAIDQIIDLDGNDVTELIEDTKIEMWEDEILELIREQNTEEPDGGF